RRLPCAGSCGTRDVRCATRIGRRCSGAGTEGAPLLPFVHGPADDRQRKSRAKTSSPPGTVRLFGPEYGASGRVPVNGARGEGRQADGDVLGPFRLRGAVANPLA